LHFPVDTWLRCIIITTEKFTCTTRLLPPKPHKKNGQMNITAIIAAAGSGLRLGSATPKQFLDLGGKPVIAWSIEAFAACSIVNAITVVTAEEYQKQTEAIISGIKARQRISVVQGGLTRQQSVENGMSACEDETGWIAVHDAARPFITPRDIEGAAMLARETGAAIMAEPVADTIKEAADGIVVRTVDRSSLFRAQTPQICRIEDLKAAYRHASETRFQGTDEASLLETAGFPVAIYESTGRNFKITTETDLLIARALASMSSETTRQVKT
jgi:2-C-methyl-D-erythritol 4-phosphate cytidylyltransferase